jgi:hypothetical protein
MKPPFRLVHTEGSSDTSACVRQLQAGVSDKSLIGLAFVAIYAGRNFEVHLCGEAARSPAFTAGPVLVLQRKLVDRMMGAS